MVATHTEEWGSASELAGNSSLVQCEVACAACGVVFKAGDWARTRYGPSGGTNFHDDCTNAKDGDHEEVPDDRRTRWR